MSWASNNTCQPTGLSWSGVFQCGLTQDHSSTRGSPFISASRRACCTEAGGRPAVRLAGWLAAVVVAAVASSSRG